MAQTVGYKNGFTAGEIGPDAWERTDLQQHAQGCAEGSNLIGLVTGPLASRGGFWDRGAVVDQSKRTRLVRFARSSGDALFLELADLTASVWTTSGERLMDGSSPYVFATPWATAVLERLFFHQVGDVVYVTDSSGLGRPRTIIRHGNFDWDVRDLEFRDGPWLAENPDGPTLTFTPSGGALDIVASEAVFSPADLGIDIRYREGDGNPGLNTWTAGTDYVLNAYVQFDGRVYQRVGGSGGNKSGTTPPLHQSGIVSDGALDWRFEHDGAGIMRVSVYHSPTHVVCTSVRNGPGMTTSAYWARSAYSSVQGWPRALSEDREERLVVAASRLQPGVVDMTRTSGFGPTYGDFKPGLGTGRVVDDDAVRLSVGGSRVVWLMSAAVLVAGCTDGEFILSGSSFDDPITPAGRRSPQVSAYGNADVAPLKVQGPPSSILHVLRSRKVLRETQVFPDRTVESRELSLLAHHIFGRGVAEMAWQQPENLVWLRLDDGGLAAMTYHKEHGVTGATRQNLPAGWRVESLAAAPAPHGGDVVMIVAHRVKAGADQRRVWLLSGREAGVFMDGAALYEGAPVSVVNVGAHRNGDRLAILSDGARIPDQEVVDGQIVLPQPSGHVLIGEKMVRRFESLPVDQEGVGSTNGRTLVPTHATVILSGVEALVGTDAPDSAERVQQRAPTELTAPVAKRIRQRVGLGGGAGRDRRIVIESDAPFDLLIHAYRLEAEATK